MKSLIWIILLGLVACQPRNKRTEQMGSTTLPKEAIVAVSECYRFVRGKDTAALTLLTTGTTVSGQLDYKWSEKDHSTGSLEGKMHGDTLVAVYSFAAEGKLSMREVVFLKKEQQVIEGFGSIEEKGGKVQFKDWRKLNFSSALVLDKVPCAQARKNGSRE